MTVMVIRPCCAQLANLVADGAARFSIENGKTKMELHVSFDPARVMVALGWVTAKLCPFCGREVP